MERHHDLYTFICFVSSDDSWFECKIDSSITYVLFVIDIFEIWYTFPLFRIPFCLSVYLVLFVPHPIQPPNTFYPVSPIWGNDYTWTTNTSSTESSIDHLPWFRNSTLVSTVWDSYSPSRVVNYDFPTSPLVSFQCLPWSRCLVHRGVCGGWYLGNMLCKSGKE